MQVWSLLALAHRTPPSSESYVIRVRTARLGAVIPVAASSTGSVGSDVGSHLFRDPLGRRVLDPVCARPSAAATAPPTVAFAGSCSCHYPTSEHRRSQDEISLCPQGNLVASGAASPCVNDPSRLLRRTRRADRPCR